MDRWGMTSAERKAAEEKEEEEEWAGGRRRGRCCRRRRGEADRDREEVESEDRKLGREWHTRSSDGRMDPIRNTVEHTDIKISTTGNAI